MPSGPVTADDFEVCDSQVLHPEQGQVLVGLRKLGLNAGLAHRLGGAGTSYGPGVAVGDVPSSDAVVEVLESADDRFTVGDLAVSRYPWSTAAVVGGEDLRRIDGDPSDEQITAQLTILGHVGFTAWTGLIHIGQVRSDEVVYVSGAAGGVGSCVVQFAKAVGATVIGGVGSAQKVQFVTGSLGADRAIDRHDGAAVDLLRSAAPEGIDLYYDNVGGEQLEAALEVLNFGGRAVICGAVAGSALPANFRNVIHRELTLRGFTVTAHEDLRTDFESDVRGWVEQGKVRSVHTAFEGIDAVPEAFEALLTGRGTGRVVVSVASQLR